MASTSSFPGKVFLRLHLLLLHLLFSGKIFAEVDRLKMPHFVTDAANGFFSWAISPFVTLASAPQTRTVVPRFCCLGFFGSAWGRFVVTRK